MKRQLIAISVLEGLLIASLVACGTPPVAESRAADAQTTTTTAPTDAAPTATAPTATAPTAAPSAAAQPTALGISGTGEVKPARDADLVFLVPGIVTEVNVQAGDVVTKGQVVAMLDTRALDQQLHQAEAALESALAQEAALTEGPRKADANAARAQIQQAQVALDQIRAGPKEQDVQSAQAALNTAQASLQATRDRLSLAKTQAEAQVQQAALELTQAQARYAQAKHNWDYVQETGKDPIVPETTDPQTGEDEPNRPSDGQRENYYSLFVQAEAALHQAEQAVQQALIAAENARQAEVTGVQIAEQQVIQAQAARDKLQRPPDPERLAAAQAALAQAQAAQARLQPAPRDSQKAQAAAGIAHAQAALELARLNRENAALRAPFDGVVAEVNIDPGDHSSAGDRRAIRLVDISKLHVEVPISDVDITRVELNQRAEVRTDALKNQVVTGTVSYIAPIATTAGNQRTYLVRVALDEQAGLRAGMGVRVDLLEH